MLTGVTGISKREDIVRGLNAIPKRIVAFLTQKELDSAGRARRQTGSPRAGDPGTVEDLVRKPETRRSAPLYLCTNYKVQFHDLSNTQVVSIV